MADHTPNIWKSPRLRCTHRILAQAVILLERDGNKVHLEFEDGSHGWHDDTDLVPIDGRTVR